MRYGENDVLTGVSFDIRARRSGLPARTERRREDHHDRDPGGLPDPFRRRGHGAGTGPGPRHRGLAGADGVVLQSWRDHPRWTPRRLLKPSAATTRRTPRPSARVRTTWTAAGDRRSDRARGPQARDPVRWSAAAARRGDRHRRTTRAAVPRRAHRRLRPPGAPGVPSAGATTGGAGGHHDPAHHARPRRGREAGGPGPDPRRRSDRGRRHGRLPGTPGRGRGRGALVGRWRAVRARRPRTPRRSSETSSPRTARRSGTSRSAGPVWRTPISTSCAQHEGHVDARRPALHGGDHVRSTHAVRLGVQRGWTEFVQSMRSTQDQGFYLFTALLVLGYLFLRRNTEVEGTDLLLPSVALPSILGALVAFGRDHRSGVRARDGAGGRHPAAAQGPAAWSDRLLHRTTRLPDPRTAAPDAGDPRSELPTFRRPDG